MPTTDHDLPYPALGDDANGPEAFQALAEAVDDVYGASVANAAALPAAGVYDGQRVTLQDTHEVAVWNAGLGQWTGYWKAYVPTLSGFTGSPTIQFARYVQHGKHVTVSVMISVGTSINSTAFVTLPVAAESTAVRAVGTCLLVDTSVGTSSRRSATVLMSGTGVFFLVDSLATAAAVTSGVPWTWAAGDELDFTFTYEAD